MRGFSPEIMDGSGFFGGEATWPQIAAMDNTADKRISRKKIFKRNYKL